MVEGTRLKVVRAEDGNGCPTCPTYVHLSDGSTHQLGCDITAKALVDSEVEIDGNTYKFHGTKFGNSLDDEPYVEQGRRTWTMVTLSDGSRHELNGDFEDGTFNGAAFDVPDRDKIGTYKTYNFTFLDGREPLTVVGFPARG